MLTTFQAAAESIGATVKRFSSVEDAVIYAKKLGGDAPVGVAALSPQLRKAFGPGYFALPEEAPASRLCVSQAQAGIAATGSMLIDLSDPKERAAAGLSLVHAVFLDAAAIVADLYALQDRLAAAIAARPTSYLSITTGPSRTADIERVLTIGVHGPKELHILIMEQ